MLIGTGILLLRPRDFPLIARGAGRLLGATVRSLRMTKQAAEEVVAENMQHANDPNSEMGLVGRGLRDSLTKFDSLAATLKKDMSNVPISPRMLLQKGMRSMDKSTHEIGSGNASDSGQEQTRAQVDPRQSDEDAAHATHFGTRIRKSIVGGERGTSCGVDFITRSIEEAAFAKQKEQILGGEARPTKAHLDTDVGESTRSDT